MRLDEGGTSRVAAPVASSQEPKDETSPPDKGGGWATRGPGSPWIASGYADAAGAREAWRNRIVVPFAVLVGSCGKYRVVTLRRAKELG